MCLLTAFVPATIGVCCFKEQFEGEGGMELGSLRGSVPVFFCWVMAVVIVM